MISLILDTDLGDDVDDVFALAYAARNPRINLCAVTTVLGNTRWRAAWRCGCWTNWAWTTCRLRPVQRAARSIP